MRFTTSFAAIVATLVTSSAAYDGFPDNLTERLGTYQAPGPNDSRGPCPGLNTLANHGLINRNGSNINSNDIMTAFPQGFGININGFFQALHNFEVVCEYAKGLTCGTEANDGTFILTNLTLLGEPHAFEHDHSYSRQDYKQNYGLGAITDNIYFNGTEYQNGLNVAGIQFTNPPTPALLTPLDLNAIRLQRIFTQFHADLPGTFLLNLPTQLFETGFIFGATFDRDSNGNMIGDEPLVRADWWEFWFNEESFPTQLGWVPASTEFFDVNFINSMSSTVLATLPASLPSPLPSGATNTTAPAPTNLPEADPSPNPPLFQETPYAAPTKPSAIASETATATTTVQAQKRGDQPQFPHITALPTLSSILHSVAKNQPHIITSASKLAGPAPQQYDLYKQQLDLNMLQNQVAAAQSFESKIAHLITSILHDIGLDENKAKPTHH